MDFERAEEYLRSFVSYERVVKVEYDTYHFDLDRIRRAIHFLKIDYSKLKFVHVAGSKGKGTVCGIVADYLVKAGFKTGLFTSPHMFDLTERIKLNNENISKQKFCRYVEDMRSFFDVHGNFGLTYFEILTIIALKFFVDENVDFAVVEVGLGGRLDATNIINSVVTVLTTVEKEHSDILGDTMEKILNEKLGIVRNKIPLIVGFQSDQVYKFIKKNLIAKDDVIFVQNFVFPDDFDDLVPFDKAKLVNAKVAFLVLKTLLGDVDQNIFNRAVADLKLVGRFDCRNIDGTNVVFDMAHTPNSIRNLLDALAEKFHGKGLIFLISVMKGKEIDEILKLLASVADLIIFTSSNPEREFSAEELADLSQNYFAKIKIIADPYLAFTRLLKDAGDEDVVVVTGSHFLVSQILRKI